MALLSNKDKYNRASELQNYYFQQSQADTDSPIKAIGRLGWALMARQQKQRQTEAKAALQEEQQARLDEFSGLEPGSADQLKFLQNQALNLDLSPEERQVYGTERKYAHDTAMQKLKSGDKGRFSIRGGEEAYLEANARGSKLPREAFFEKDGVTPRYYKFSATDLERWYPEGEPKGKDGEGFTDPVAKSAYAISGAGNVLNKVDNLRELAAKAHDNNFITNPSSVISHLLGTWRLSDDTTTLFRAAEEIGNSMVEDIRQTQEQLGLGQSGTFAKDDAIRLQGLIADLSPVDENGNPRVPIKADEFNRRLNVIMNEWENKLANNLMQWKQVKGPVTQDGKKPQRLYAYGIEKPEYDMTEMTPEEMFVFLNEIAAGSEYGQDYNENIDPFVFRLINKALTNKGKDKRSRYQELYIKSLELPQGWSTE